MGTTRYPLPPLATVEPQSLWGRLYQFLEWLEVRRYAESSVRTHRYNASAFIHWCEDRTLLRPNDVTRPVLERYQRHLFNYRKSNGKKLSFHSLTSRIGTLRVFFRWLARQNIILHNPASELESPMGEKRLPREVLAPGEVEQVLAVPDTRTLYGLRDRAILEVFYSTGMRRTELVSLGLFDLHRERRVVFVRQGKGNKDRYLPIGERTLAWVEKYLDEVRPQLVCGDDPGWLFLSYTGEKLSAGWLTHHVSRYVKASGVRSKGSCHLFRHSMATAMLENGADVRFVQHMLGHASLSTTEIYTHVSIKALQEVHERTHPSAKLRPGALSRRHQDNDHGTSLELLEQTLEEEAAQEQPDE